MFETAHRPQLAARPDRPPVVRLGGPGVALVLGACFALSLAGSEWIWLAAAPYPYVCLTNGSVPFLLAAVAFAGGAFTVRRGDAEFVLWTTLGAATFAAVVLYHALFPDPQAERFRLVFYCVLPTAFLAGAIGYHYGHDRAFSGWLAGRIAAATALLGIPLALLPEANPGDPFPGPVIGYPVGLLPIFGLAWFLRRVLVERRPSRGACLGLLLGAAGVFLRFRKPIVLPAAVGLAGLVLALGHDGRIAVRVWRRLAALALATSLGLVMANSLSSGALYDAIEWIILEKYLHQEGGYVREQGLDLLEEASGGRFEIWREAAVRFAESPLIGRGFGQLVGSEFDTVGKLPLHNAYLDLSLSVGALGCLPIAVGLGWWFRQVLARRARARPDELRLPIVAYVLAMMAYNFGSMVYYFQTATGLACFLMGLALGRVGAR